MARSGKRGRPRGSTELDEETRLWVGGTYVSIERNAAALRLQRAREELPRNFDKDMADLQNDGLAFGIDGIVDNIENVEGWTIPVEAVVPRAYDLHPKIVRYLVQQVRRRYAKTISAETVKRCRREFLELEAELRAETASYKPGRNVSKGNY